MSAIENEISVLFVCMGNICRSPTAEGIFRQHVSDAGLEDVIHIDSAGTHAYHTGEPADRRAQFAAERRGYSLVDIRARPVVAADFEKFDYILVMDRQNLSALQQRVAEDVWPKLALLLDYETSANTEVPDPYYGGAAGFERVIDLVEAASTGLLEAIRERHL